MGQRPQHDPGQPGKRVGRVGCWLGQGDERLAARGAAWPTHEVPVPTARPTITSVLVARRASSVWAVILVFSWCVNGYQHSAWIAGQATADSHLTQPDTRSWVLTWSDSATLECFVQADVPGNCDRQTILCPVEEGIANRLVRDDRGTLAPHGDLLGGTHGRRAGQFRSLGKGKGDSGRVVVAQNDRFPVLEYLDQGGACRVRIRAGEVGIRPVPWPRPASRVWALGPWRRRPRLHPVSRRQRDRQTGPDSAQSSGPPWLPWPKALPS